ncbi:MAG: hypothetical protein AAGF78_05905 [Pseudomonadota bacterium]
MIRRSLQTLGLLALTLGAVAPPASAQNAVSDPDLRQAIVTATQQHVQLRQNGAYPDAWAFFTDGTQQIISLPDYSAFEAETRERVGGLDEFSVLRILEAEQPDTYVLDFAGIYEGDFYECGYFVWRMVDGALRIARAQRGFSSFEDLTSDQGAGMLSQLGCQVHSRKLLERAGFTG